MKLSQLTLVLLFSLFSFVQHIEAQSDVTTSEYKDYTDEENEAAQKFLNNLYQTGIGHAGDSVVYNEEAKLLLASAEYRNLIYPPQYSWEAVREFMNRKALKQAFWYMINIFPSSKENEELVLKMIIPFDDHIEMDKVMTSTFYTYIAFDPLVSKIENGKVVETHRPDIAEQKLASTEAIVKNILYYRDLKKKK